MSYDFSDSQLFALRFSNDDEFLKLVEDTVSENLNADHIKKRIKTGKQITEEFKETKRLHRDGVFLYLWPFKIMDAVFIINPFSAKKL